ncbi:type 2C protein phosphatase PTC6 KNAG_0I02760 [Huiozyma naganishii CBS 8797]|uniref:PPM-type phosphatase domain-containing protein n=1 Tax=Huiozyma naganishii (strain ATCC MYA-139 / BCRC 22969 / CBS 8797 / KCTC 17520 / NBRC 10181 / NCYC 3082 / Yp74L-3) TaxID=1071383 RepID=J7SAD3_HUIN7|nr:hypothetical protein KNAG_0I02760 [Kazachstania naganishii CBS 8797]CCK72061.1 hypothetical protein KNAG_0I02760 [Kazachstania naganishii CBS 8797]
MVTGGCCLRAGEPVMGVASGYVRAAGGKLRVPLLRFPGAVGHATSRVNRLQNDDAYAIQMLRGGGGGARSGAVLYMSLFDGHGPRGKEMAQSLAAGLHVELVEQRDRGLVRADLYSLLERYYKVIGGAYWQKLYRNRQQFYDRFVKNCHTKQEQVLYDSENLGTRMLFDKWGNLIDKNSLLNEAQRLALYYTFLKFDLEKCCGFGSGEVHDKGEPSGGSTASSVFVSPWDEYNSGSCNDDAFFVEPRGLLKLVVTQVGDSRVLICDSSGLAHNLSTPHHVTSARESQRLDTKVREADLDAFGDARFLNNYANTRSFGDLPAKIHGLSAEPDIFSYLVGNTRDLPYSERSKLQFGGDECFVALVTDGVSDLLVDQEIVDLITTTVNGRGLRTATPQLVAEEVIKFIVSIAPKHADNATCLVLRLSNWGNWPTLDRTGAAREALLING